MILPSALVARFAPGTTSVRLSDLIAENKRRYYEENREKIAENMRRYREENREKIAENMRRYYEENREKWKIYAQNRKGKGRRS